VELSAKTIMWIICHCTWLFICIKNR